MARTRSYKSILKKTALGFGTVFALLLIATGAAAVFLDTAAGHRWILGRINSDGFHIDRLDGSIYGDLTVTGIDIRDANGPWMRIPIARIDWRPAALLDGKLHVVSLEAETILVMRQPLPSAETSDSGRGLPEPPIDFLIERIAVTGITLAEPVAGFPASLELQAGAQYEEGAAAKLDLDIRRTDAASDRVTAKIVLDTVSRAFDLDLDVESPGGGVISGVLGFNHTTAATVSGEGSLDLWQGDLTGLVDGETVLNASVMLKDGTFSLDGTAHPPGFLGSDVLRFTGESAPLSLAMEFAAPCDNCVAIQARLQPRAADVRLTGSINLEDFSLPAPADFRITARDLDLIKDYIRPVELAAIEAAGTVSGTFSKPVIQTAVTVNDVRAEGFTTKTLTADLTATLLPATLLFEIEGSVLEPELDQSPGFTALLGRTVKITSSGRWDPQGQTFAFKNLTVNADTLSLETRGELDMAGAADLAFTAALPSLAPLGDMAGIPLSGSITLNGTVEAADSTSPYQIALTARAENFSAEDTIINGLAGPSPSLAAAVSLGRDGRLQVTALEILAKAMTVTMTGQYGGAANALSADYEAIISDLTPLTGDSGLNLEGGLAVSGTIGGTTEQIDATAESHFSDLTIQSIRFFNVQSKLDIMDITHGIHGIFSLTGDSTLGPLRLHIGLDRNDAGSFLIQNIDGAIGPATLGGNLIIQPEKPIIGSLVVGTVELTGAEINPAPYGLRGTVNLTVILADENDRQKIDFTADAANLRAVLNEADLLSVESFDATGTVVTGNGDPVVDIRLTGEDIGYRFIALESLTASAENENGGIHFEIAPMGRAGAPFDLAIEGQIQSAEAGQVIAVTLNGTVDDETISTPEPIIYQTNESEMTIQPATVMLGEGSLTLEALRQPSGLTRASIGLENADLSLVAAFVPIWPIVAVMTGDIRFETQPGATPKADFQIRAENLRPAFRPGDDERWADLEISGSLADNRLQAEGIFSADDAMTANFSAEVPLVIDAVTLAADIPAEGSVAGSFRWRGQVAPVWDLFDMPDHLVEGNLNLDLTVAGTVAAPHVTGSLTLAEGHYEYFDAGLILAGLNISAAIDGRRFTIQQASGTDGGNGRIMLSGWLDLLPEDRFPAELNLSVANALLVRRTEARVRTSAELLYKRESATSLLSGTVDINRAEIELLDRLPPSVVKIAVVEINGPETEAEENGVAREQEKPLSFDLTVNAPQEIFIRGKGIDSEWGGALAVTGSVDAPRLTGSLDILRGNFEFIGRRFDLQEGEIRFDGGSDIDPRLNILANYQKQGFSADLRIGGRVSLPTISLTSIPSLPQDEIIARILFGTTTTSLSPIEAVQLAGVVTSLANGGGGFDPVTAARRTLGIDRLSIEESREEGRGTTISGGKYLTNNIYLEVDTASGTGETTARIEAELTHNLSLETKMNSRRDSSLAIRWSWTY